MTDPSDHGSTAHQDDMRRGFLFKFSAALVGGLSAIIPVAFGGGFFLTPLLKKKKGGEDGDSFLMVGSTDSLTPGGPPRAFRVSGTKTDAWTTYAEAAIGSVYVSMNEAGNLSAFNATCPHLGCTVNYKADANSYICPCHDSAFKPDGERTNDIPPRPMDSLEVEIRNNTEVWVKFQNFRAGTSEKIPV
ncbi:ubiquinol-cytochrome c reductase iron-sulfur subunit [Thalassoglobus polymorphus]|uniref:Cytochrome b6-f complex iron-sulfur subunit n=1 Tax=Thalassoglobus polymorphus TaxID=2527994 RepID=A0A517QNN7_9PLAN|nr:Rieske 2Fe-2S domain-containing protein [Thalassoglobus polymorphus]QDT33246.1 Cytochrome b6-f complex iron-sulfur subunit [Thalassoglobus polymorphus]